MLQYKDYLDANLDEQNLIIQEILNFITSEKKFVCEEDLIKYKSRLNRAYLKLILVWLHFIDYIIIDEEAIYINSKFLRISNNINYLINIFTLKSEFILQTNTDINYNNVNVDEFEVFSNFLKFYHDNVLNKYDEFANKQIYRILKS